MNNFITKKKYQFEIINFAFVHGRWSFLILIIQMKSNHFNEINYCHEIESFGWKSSLWYEFIFFMKTQLCDENSTFKSNLDYELQNFTTNQGLHFKFPHTTPKTACQCLYAKEMRWIGPKMTELEPFLWRR